MTNTTYFKDFCGATAKVVEHRDGTATLTTHIGGKRKSKDYSSKKGAISAWRRMCN